VVAVLCVAMPVVHVVDMVIVGNGNVTAVAAMLVGVAFVGRVIADLALVGMVFVHPVEVPVVRVVDVIVVRNGNVSATVAMLVGVALM
jgi:hypothetical protein